MALTEKQRKFLRGQAHALRPCVTVAAKGLSDSLLAELGEQLEHHELIKVKLRVGDRDLRAAIITEMSARGRAECVARIGNVAVLYRARPENPGITLP